LNKAFLNWIVPLTGSLIAVVLLFFLYRGLDTSLFIKALASANPVFLGILCLSILAEQLLRGFKWRYILYDLKLISAYRLFGAILAGYGANILVPVGISPLVRSWIVARLEELRMVTVLATAAIDRFIDGIVFALIAIIVAVFGVLPSVEGNLKQGLAIAGIVNLLLFGGLLWLLFINRTRLRHEASRPGPVIDWISLKLGKRLVSLGSSIADGILWPREKGRGLAIILLSVLMKILAITYFFWAGLAIGVVLQFWDYLFLFLFAGFALILARFIRIPGGFVIGSAYALKLVGIAEEPALAMILFLHGFSIILMVVPGLIVLWRNRIEVRSLPQQSMK